MQSLKQNDTYITMRTPPCRRSSVERCGPAKAEAKQRHCVPEASGCGLGQDGACGGEGGGAAGQ